MQIAFGKQHAKSWKDVLREQGAFDSNGAPGWEPLIGIIIAGKRDKGRERLERLSAMWRGAKEHVDGICPDLVAPVVRFDLAGTEGQAPPEFFRELIVPVRKDCLATTIHAGEEASADSIWSAIFSLNATRIGHGLTLFQSRELVHYVLDRRIAVEMCPYSNRYTNALREFTEIKGHNYLEGLGGRRGAAQLNSSCPRMALGWFAIHFGSTSGWACDSASTRTTRM